MKRRMLIVVLFLALLLLLLAYIQQHNKAIDAYIKLTNEQSNKIEYLENRVQELDQVNVELAKRLKEKPEPTQAIAEEPVEEPSIPRVVDGKVVIVGILASMGGFFKQLIPAL